jgi:hypothetical protein
MPTIPVVFPASLIGEIRALFGGTTNAETEAAVKAYLVACLKDKLRQERYRLAEMAAKATVEEPDVT